MHAEEPGGHLRLLLSFLTPPVAVAAYAAASIAKANPIATALQSMRFGWTAYIVPFLLCSLPR